MHAGQGCEVFAVMPHLGHWKTKTISGWLGMGMAIIPIDLYQDKTVCWLIGSLNLNQNTKSSVLWLELLWFLTFWKGFWKRYGYCLMSNCCASLISSFTFVNVVNFSIHVLINKFVIFSSNFVLFVVMRLFGVCDPCKTIHIYQ